MFGKWAMPQGASDVGHLMVGQRIRVGKRQLDTSNLFTFPFGLHAVGDYCPKACAAVGPLARDASL
jgi:hypothetical protein